MSTTPTPATLAEVAVVNSTGHRVQVLRRESIRHDEQIMRALDLAGNFVIGTPQGFRYRRPKVRRFTRPAADTVFMIDNQGRATAALPGAYFQTHYTVIQT